MKVLAIGAHPDDPEIGCGATLAKYAENGADVSVYFLSTGEGSRKIQDSVSRMKCAVAAAYILGVKKMGNHVLPDQRFDTISFLEIVQKIEHQIEIIKPNIVFTHWHGDLNIDHQLTARATLTACRPLPNSVINSIYSYEVPSSTEWGTQPFMPNHYESISPSQYEKKIAALECYGSEIKPNPHARSWQSINALMSKRGAEVGVDNAEAFYNYKTVRR